MKDIWSRLNWPQVVVLAVTLGGAVLFAIFAPIDWSTLPWEAFISGAITIAGIVYGATKDRVVARPSSPPAAPPPPPRRVPAPKREGSVDPTALGFVLAFGVALAAAILARGGAL